MVENSLVVINPFERILIWAKLIQYTWYHLTNILWAPKSRIRINGQTKLDRHRTSSINVYCSQCSGVNTEEHSNIRAFEQLWFRFHAQNKNNNTKTQFTRIKWTIIVFLMRINVPYHSHRYVCFGLISLFFSFQIFFSHFVLCLFSLSFVFSIARPIRVHLSQQLIWYFVKFELRENSISE